MENRTQFDLSVALQHWRENLTQSPQFRPENVQELESHLHDSISTWQSKGLSDEEAFFIATGRLGAAPTLETEFAKVNNKEVWLDRLLWMAIGIQLLWLLSGLSSFLAGTAVIGLWSLGYQFQWNPNHPYAAAIIPGALAVLVQLLTIGLGAWGLHLLFQPRWRILSVLAGHSFRRPIMVGLALVGGSMLLTLSRCGLLDILPSMRLPHEQFAVMSMSRSFAGVLVFAVTGLILAALTVFLARRRLRLRVNS